MKAVFAAFLACATCPLMLMACAAPATGIVQENRSAQSISTEANSAKASGQELRQPNILLIAVDDLRPDIGVYGHPTAQTPHMDAFAESALLFENAITQKAVCAPSRAALMTGLRPDTTGITTLNQPIDDTVPNAVTLADFFKSKGYETLSIGKIYHHRDDDADAWTVAPYNKNSDVRRARRNAGEPNISFAREDAMSNLPDLQNAQHAKSELARLAAADTPFFMAFGIHKPHLPFFAPNQAWDSYSAANIPEPVSRTPQAGAPDWAIVAWEIWNYEDTPEQSEDGLTDMPEPLADDLRHGYLAAVTYADSIIGDIVAEVENLGLADDTIIVIWGDHGFKLGDYNAWAKHSNANLDIQIPLMIRVPGITNNAMRSPAMVETVDVYPTLVQLAGFEVPEHIEGLSVRPLLSDPLKSWKAAAFAQFNRSSSGIGTMDGRTVRTEDYRYTAWVSRNTGQIVDTELYDLSRDPNELTNVAEDPVYSNIVDAHELLRQKGWKPVRENVNGH